MTGQPPLPEREVVRRSRGSIWLGLALPAAVMLGRLAVHSVLADPPAPDDPKAAGWERLRSALQPLTFRPEYLLAALVLGGTVLAVIPRTRRTGFGVLIGTVISALVLVGVVLLIAYSLAGANIEP